MPNPRWATEDQAAEHVGVSVYTIRRWRDQGLIAGYRFGSRCLRYDLNEIDAMATRNDDVTGERSAAHQDA
ncbi:MAG: helix-turn-helix domain-containing protein [Mycobacterium kyogaense]|uniref:helix-turn-helix transcriptional regulator n=1 Tax=Mycobacterium kyogaense TaxID=2212479 RepID=UPI002FFD4E29